MSAGSGKMLLCVCKRKDPISVSGRYWRAFFETGHDVHYGVRNKLVTMILNACRLCTFLVVSNKLYLHSMVLCHTINCQVYFLKYVTWVVQDSNSPAGNIVKDCSWPVMDLLRTFTYPMTLCGPTEVYS